MARNGGQLSYEGGQAFGGGCVSAVIVAPIVLLVSAYAGHVSELLGDAVIVVVLLALAIAWLGQGK